MKLLIKRLLIIDKDGDILVRIQLLGKQHQEILDDFAKVSTIITLILIMLQKWGMWYFIMLIITFLLHMHRKV